MNMGQKKIRTMSVLTKLFKGVEQDVRTPFELFRKLDDEFHFQLDPCTSTSKPGNLGTQYSFVFPEKDGLKESWSHYKSIFVNPPFKHANKWVEKAYNESKKGATVVVLVPVKSDTAWWHDFALKATEIRFVRGRLIFEGYKYPFIIGICLLIFRPYGKPNR